MFIFSFNIILSFFVALFCTPTLVHAPSTPSCHGAKVSGIGIPITNADTADVIANLYIVLYNRNATDDAVQMHQAFVMKALRGVDFEARSEEGKMLSSKMDAFSMSGSRGMPLGAGDSMILQIANAT
jgi:hypothetical protein